MEVRAVTRRCIGLDVHREFAQVAIWQDGLVRQAGQIAMTPEALRVFADSLAPSDEVALEATGNTHAIVRALQGRVARVGRFGLGRRLALVRLGLGGREAVTLASRRKLKRLHRPAPNELAERGVDDVLVDAGGPRDLGGGDTSAVANHREDRLAVGAAGPALSGLRLRRCRVAHAPRPYRSGLLVEALQGSQCRPKTLMLVDQRGKLGDARLHLTD